MSSQKYYKEYLFGTTDGTTTMIITALSYHFAVKILHGYVKNKKEWNFLEEQKISFAESLLPKEMRK